MNRKPIFDAVRKLLGRGFNQGEVDALDAACELAEGSVAGSIATRRIPPPRSAMSGSRKLGEAGLKLVKEFEGCHKALGGGKFQAYPDPGSDDGRPWTIGWGSTGADIKPGTTWTQDQCDDRFRTDMQRYADAVSRAIGDAPTTQNQFDALVSFHYNTGAIASATLTKKHKARDYVGAKAEFARWNKNAGRVMRGLTRRREAEAALYAKP
jgi:GH24 family phage-related lysozyme (muramidase)